MVNLKKLKKNLLTKTKIEDDYDFPRNQLLSSGSTLLNLACSNNHRGAFLKGKYYLIVGDSASGKTALSLTCLAEAARSPHFEGYRLIHDDVEGGALHNIRKLFGESLKERLETFHSSTLEEMYYNIDDCIKAKKPFIYVVDSMDSLDTEDDEEKFQEQKTAHRKGKTTSGSYGASKPKMNSSNLRRLMTPLRNSGSILIFISQTRDNLGFGFQKKTRSGGHALRFYTTLEIWSSIKEKIKYTVKGKPRAVGIISKIEVKKNRITGMERTIIIPIYYDIGFDDVGSCVQYLIEENHWKKTGGRINAPEFDFNGTQEKLAQYVSEREMREKKLQMIVSRVWKEIEKGCQIIRRRKYE